MSTSKGSGAAKRNVDVAGKRLGIKKFGGEFVIPGNIIVRQRGTRFHAGENVKIGRDHTLFATAEGFVSFKRLTGFKRHLKQVNVLPEQTKASQKPKTQKKEVVEVAASKATKKPAVKKTSAKKTAAKK